MTASGSASSRGASSLGAIVAAVDTLAVRSCIDDGGVIASNGNGLADFQLLRRRKRDDQAVLCVFDLIEIDGRDLRDEPRPERWRGGYVG
jgi:ATP-dependent DNA ligase